MPCQGRSGFGDKAVSPGILKIYGYKEEQHHRQSVCRHRRNIRSNTATENYVIINNHDPEVQIQEIGDADIVMIANMPLSGKVISACPNLKFIDVAFTGVDHVDLQAAKEKGIAVSNASGYSNESVAELCHLFGCEIAAYDLFPKKNAPEYLHYGTLEEVLSKSDIVTLHCPLTEDSRNLINQDRIAQMKKGAILINAARGPIVDSKALADALNSGYLRGAGVDVFEMEPPLPMDHPLLHSMNTIVTPHIAFASDESMEIRAEIVFENIQKWMNKEQVNIIL